MPLQSTNYGGAKLDRLYSIRLQRHTDVEVTSGTTMDTLTGGDRVHV